MGTEGNRSFSILHAEDDDDDAFFVQHALAKLQLPLSLTRVINGQAALEYLASRKAPGRSNLPDLLLLDLKLPLLDGFEVLRAIRGNPELEELDVVILSSSGQERDRQQARELGANDYLVKSASFADVARAVAQRLSLANSVPDLQGRA